MDEKQGINEVLEELKQDEMNPELIQDNKIHFRVGDDIYRVRTANQKESFNATNHKNKIYIRLIQEDNTLTLKQLKRVLKDKKSIDVDKLDEQADKLEKELMQVYLSLAKKKNSDKKSIKKLKDDIYRIREERLSIVIEKAELLSPAIEHQAQDEYYRFLTAICTEKLIKEDKWKKAWKTWEAFENDGTKLPYLSLGKFTELVFGG